ncbi:threonylcarbamoyl-AMP synthase [Planococcus citri]|uniref:threonylcarbamoyl-AMP synthase n=1 Tax=Planococcus citri TaxID=170843 RepID=UPI0031F75F53
MVLKIFHFLFVPSRCLNMNRSLKDIAVGRNASGNVFRLSKNIEHCVSIAVEHIQRGDIIALPTDTIYGLAASAQSVTAIHKLYQIKDRSYCKPIAICVSEVGKIHQWGKIDHLPQKILFELLPGPVTVIVERTNRLNHKLNPGVSKVGIRIPDNVFIQKLTSALDVPLALTSANKSNQTSTVTVDEFSPLWNHLGAVFDGGKIGDDRAGSTIVDLSVPGKYEIIRQGSDFDVTIDILKKYNLEEN